MAKKWATALVDVETAFSHGDLEEEVCMKVAQGMKESGIEVDEEDGCLLLEKPVRSSLRQVRGTSHW
jgi:hypothetical protein